MQQNVNPEGRLYRGLIICNLNDHNEQIKFKLIRRYKSFDRGQEKILQEIVTRRQETNFEFQLSHKVTCVVQRDSNNDFFFFVLLVFTKSLNYREIKSKVQNDLQQIQLLFKKVNNYQIKSMQDLQLAKQQDAELRIKQLEDATCRDLSYQYFGDFSEDENKKKWTQASPNQAKKKNKESEVKTDLNRTVIGIHKGQNVNIKTFDVTIEPQPKQNEVLPLSVNEVLNWAISVTFIVFCGVLYLIFMG